MASQANGALCEMWQARLLRPRQGPPIYRETLHRGGRLKSNPPPWRVTGCDDEEEHHQGRVIPLGQSQAPMHPEFHFDDEPPPLAQFDAFKAKHPLVKGQLISAARRAVTLFGKCSIHLAYELAGILYDLHCSRTWLPAFAREIAAECAADDELKNVFKTRPSRFDRRRP